MGRGNLDCLTTEGFVAFLLQALPAYEQDVFQASISLHISRVLLKCMKLWWKLADFFFSLILQLYNCKAHWMQCYYSWYSFIIFFQDIIGLIMNFLFSLNLQYVIGRNLSACNNGQLTGIRMGFSCMTARLCLRQCVYSQKWVERIGVWTTVWY